MTAGFTIPCKFPSQLAGRPWSLKTLKADTITEKIYVPVEDDWVPPPDSLGMKQLSPEELIAQSEAMDALSKEWRNKRLDNEYENSRLLGFSKQAEILNGRSAMFFIIVALVTEQVTGDSIPDQVFVLLQTLGIIGLDS